MDQTKSLTVPISESSTLIGDLMPVTTYNIRILAENSLGQSKPSEPITVTTNEEGKSKLLLYTPMKLRFLSMWVEWLDCLK